MTNHLWRTTPIPERRREVAQHLERGNTFATIALHYNTTRSSIAGFAKREGLHSRKSPTIPPPSAHVWRPVKGSKLTTYLLVTTGCRWPVGDNTPALACNAVTEPDNVYCAIHHKIGVKHVCT